MSKSNVSVNVDDLGQVVVTFTNDITIMLYQEKNQHFRGFKVRSVDDAFAIKMSGAVNVLEVETRRIGT